MIKDNQLELKNPNVKVMERKQRTTRINVFAEKVKRSIMMNRISYLNEVFWKS